MTRKITRSGLDSLRLREYLIENEFNCFHLLSNFDIYGTENTGAYLRQGDYYVAEHSGEITGVMTVYNDMFAYAYVPLSEDIRDFADVCSEYHLKMLQGAPAANIVRVHDYIRDMYPVIEAREGEIIHCDNPTKLEMRDGITVKQIDKGDIKAITDAARIFNNAQGEDWSVEYFTRLVDEMRGGEAVFLSYIDNSPCGTLTVSAESHKYHYAGLMGVDSAYRGKGIGSMLMSVVTNRAIELNHVAIGCVAKDNMPSKRMLINCGYTLNLGSYQFIWYY